MNFTTYSCLATQNLVRKLQGVPVAAKLWVFHTVWACFTSSTPMAPDTRHSHRASQTQRGQTGLSFQLRHPPIVLPTFLWVTAATRRKKLLSGAQASWEGAGERTRMGGWKAPGDGQEAADKKFYKREYHRHKNTEKIISQQAPRLLLHTVWRRGLGDGQVGSDWRSIKHIDRYDHLHHWKPSHSHLPSSDSLYWKLHFHNFLREFFI